MALKELLPVLMLFWKSSKDNRKKWPPFCLKLSQLKTDTVPVHKNTEYYQQDYQQNSFFRRKSVLFLQQPICFHHVRLYNLSFQTHILGRGARDFNPCLREESTGAQHKYNIHNCMYRVFQNRRKGLWRWQIVTESTNWISTSRASRWCVLEEGSKQSVTNLLTIS